jgi:hypothetical protein
MRVVRTTLSNTDALGHVLLAHLKAVPQPAGARAPNEERVSKPPASAKPSKPSEEPPEEGTN